MDNKYIDVFPDKIRLSKTYEQNFYEARITLTNLTNSYIVFKVYINKSTIYSANPSSSYIKPKESITISVKRLEKDADKEIKSSSDKFLIIAFPTNNVINSNTEAKALMTESNMKSKNKQELFLFVEYESEKQQQEQPLRNTIANTSTPNIDERISIKKFESGRTIDETTEQMTPEAKLEETKRLIEETKRKIGQMESQISILDNQLNNYGKYSGLHQRKSKVLSIEKETPHSANSYPLSATIFIVTFGLVLGAYLNKLLSGSSY